MSWTLLHFNCRRITDRCKVRSLQLQKKYAFQYNGLKSMCTSQDELITQDINGKGVITFNRPKVMNIINAEMMKKCYSYLKTWENEKLFVIAKGSGGKAFCAGGDMKQMSDFLLNNEKMESLPQDLEFYLNYIISLINSYKIPYIALVDGYAMGGGMGFSVFGKYCIATENAVFAMPEAQFGFFPNSGASYFFPRMSGHLGWYLALTAGRIKGSDAVREGLATHYCLSKNLNGLEEGLLNCYNEEDVKDVLHEFTEKDLPEYTLAPLTDKINICFSAHTVEEIISKLENDGSSWAQDTIAILNQMSPTSLKVIKKQLDFGKQMSLKDCLHMEYRLHHNFIRIGNFLEGIRAKFLEKDGKPKWNPSTLSEVSDEFVLSHFAKVQDDERYERFILSSN